MIFLPPSPGYKDDEKTIKIKTQDGETISAFYLPNEEAKYTLLISHGNAEDIGHMLPYLHELKSQGFSVFAYDYRGYGTSSGNPTEQSAYADISANYAYLTQTIGVPAERIIVMGSSLGAALAIDLAAREPVAGLIVESPFVTAFRVVTYVPLLPFDKFDNMGKISNVRCPILFVHGTHDRIVPIWHGRKLYEVATAPKQNFWVEGGGHNDLLWVAGNRYWQAIHAFVAGF